MPDQPTIMRLGLFLAIGYLCTGVVLNSLVSLPLFANLFNQSTYGLLAISLTIFGLLCVGHVLIPKLLKCFKLKFAVLCYMIAAGLLLLVFNYNRLTLCFGLVLTLSPISYLAKLHITRQTPWLINQAHGMWCFGIWLLAPLLVVMSFVSSPVTEELTSRLLFSHFLLINAWLYLLKDYGDELMNDENHIYNASFHSILKNFEAHEETDAQDSAQDSNVPQVDPLQPNKLAQGANSPQPSHTVAQAKNANKNIKTYTRAPSTNLGNFEAKPANDISASSLIDKTINPITNSKDAQRILDDINTLDSILSQTSEAQYNSDGSINLTGVDSKIQMPNGIPLDTNNEKDFASTSDYYPPLELTKTEEEAMTILGKAIEEGSAPSSTNTLDMGALALDEKTASEDGLVNELGDAFAYTNLSQHIADMTNADVSHLQKEQALPSVFDPESDEIPEWLEADALQETKDESTNTNLLPGNFAEQQAKSQLDLTAPYSSGKIEEQFTPSASTLPSQEKIPFDLRDAIASGAIAGLTDPNSVNGMATDSLSSLLPPLNASQENTVSKQFTPSASSNANAQTKQFTPSASSLDNPKPNTVDFDHSLDSAPINYTKTASDGTNTPLGYTSLEQNQLLNSNDLPNPSSPTTPTQNTAKLLDLHATDGKEQSSSYQAPSGGILQAPKLDQEQLQRHKQEREKQYTSSARSAGGSFDYTPLQNNARQPSMNYSPQQNYGGNLPKYTNATRKAAPKLEYSTWNIPASNKKPLPKLKRKSNQSNIISYGTPVFNRSSPSFNYTKVQKAPLLAQNKPQQSGSISLQNAAAKKQQVTAVNTKEISGDVFDFETLLKQTQPQFSPSASASPQANKEQIGFGASQDPNAKARMQFSIEDAVQADLQYAQHPELGEAGQMQYTALETSHKQPQLDYSGLSSAFNSPRMQYTNLQRSGGRTYASGGVEVVYKTKQATTTPKVDPEKIAKLREQVLFNPNLTPEQIATIKANTNINDSTIRNAPRQSGIANYEAPAQDLERVSMLGSKTSFSSSLLDPTQKAKFNAKMQAKERAQAQAKAKVQSMAMTRKQAQQRKQEEKDDEDLEELLLQLRNRRRNQNYGRRSIFINR